mmetsp:Transcript_30117/g.70234  ORF Transcript_30117/g.70234 Transcript_30117/m.70234 type:complete len:518 (-) Transcript_30117:21-1574(-)
MASWLKQRESLLFYLLRYAILCSLLNEPVLGLGIHLHNIQATRQIAAEKLRSEHEASSNIVATSSVVQSPNTTCDYHSCGPHSECTNTPSGAECVCNEGYIGLGVDCRAPPEYRPQRLLYEGTGGRRTEALDLHVCAFSHNEVAVVFRDLNKGGVGRITLGRIHEGGVAEMVPPQQFTLARGKAYDPIVAGSEGRRLVLAWRDTNRQGVGWVRGVAVGAAGIRGATHSMTWSEPMAVVHDVSQKMALVPLPNERFAVMYVEKVLATNTAPVHYYGNAALLNVDGAGSLVLLGRYQFSDAAICRLEVTRISPSVFVIGGRMSPQLGEFEYEEFPNISREAVVIHGKLDQDQLRFGSTPLNLEPNATQVWARGLSLIAANTFAYTYQTGSPRLNLKTAVIQVDARTDAMSILDGPVTVRAGFTPTVEMLSVPYSASEPHTLTLFKDPGSNASKVNLCSWDHGLHLLTNCEDFTWMQEEVESSSAVHLPGGKAFVVFTPTSRVPHYTLFGVARRPLYGIY